MCMVKILIIANTVIWDQGCYEGSKAGTAVREPATKIQGTGTPAVPPPAEPPMLLGPYNVTLVTEPKRQELKAAGSTADTAQPQSSDGEWQCRREVLKTLPCNNFFYRPLPLPYRDPVHLLSPIALLTKRSRLFGCMGPRHSWWWPQWKLIVNGWKTLLIY